MRRREGPAKDRVRWMHGGTAELIHDGVWEARKEGPVDLSELFTSFRGMTRSLPSQVVSSLVLMMKRERWAIPRRCVNDFDKPGLGTIGPHLIRRREEVARITPLNRIRRRLQ